MINDRRLAQLLRKIGIDTNFLGKLPEPVAENLFNRHVSNLKLSYHPDTYTHLGKMPKGVENRFKEFTNINLVLSDLSFSKIHSACKLSNASSKDSQIRELERELDEKGLVNSDNLNDILKRFVLNQYSHKLQDLYSDSYLVVSAPNVLFDNNHIISVDNLFENSWFLQNVDSENEVRKINEKDRLENLIQKSNDRLKSERQKLEDYDMAISEISMKYSNLENLDEKEIEDVLRSNYLEERTKVNELGGEIKDLLEGHELRGIVLDDNFSSDLRGLDVHSGDNPYENDEDKELRKIRSDINLELLNKLPSELRETYVESRSMLRRFNNALKHYKDLISEGEPLNELERKEDIIKRLKSEVNIIIKKNKLKKDTTNLEINDIEKRIVTYGKKINSLDNSDLLLRKRDKRNIDKDTFGVYYNSLNPIHKNYFLARNNNFSSGANPLVFDGILDRVFYPITLLHFDEGGNISYHNIKNLDEDVPKSEDFIKTNRKIVSILSPGKINDYFVKTQGKKLRVVEGGRGRKDDAISLNDVLESRCYENFLTKPNEGLVIMSVDYTESYPIYRIEGKTSSYFFKDVNEPKIFPNSNTLKYVRSLKK